MVQVMKEVAKSLGYNVITRKRKRISWENYENHTLNTTKTTSSKALHQMKTTKIAAGEIDVGEMVVPIEYDVMSVKADGSLVRCYNLLYYERYMFMKNAPDINFHA